MHIFDKSNLYRKEWEGEDSLRNASIRFSAIDVSAKRVTKTTFSVSDLIGASIKSNQEHIIEISVLPLDLRTAWGRKTNNPTKRNLYVKYDDSLYRALNTMQEHQLMQLILLEHSMIWCLEEKWNLNVQELNFLLTSHIFKFHNWQYSIYYFLIKSNIFMQSNNLYETLLKYMHCNFSKMFILN